MGNACSRQDDSADMDPSSSQPRSGGERRPTTMVSSHDQTTTATAKGDGSKESSSTKPPQSTEGSLTATPVFGGMKLVEEGEEITPRSPPITLTTTPPAPRASINTQSIPIPTPKPPPKFNARNSVGGSSSLAGVNYMLETGGASRSGFGASASVSKADRGQQKRRRKVAQNSTAAAATVVMSTGFAPFNSPSDSPKTSCTSASASPSVLTPTGHPQPRPIPTDLGSPDSPEIAEDFASLPMSSFVSDTKFGIGGMTAINTFKPSMTVIGSGDQPQLLASGGLSARSNGSDQSGRTSGRGTSERIRVTSFIGGPAPLIDAPQPPSPESTTPPSTDKNLQQQTHDDDEVNSHHMDDAEMLEAALGGVYRSQSSGGSGSTQTTSPVSGLPNIYTAPPSKQGTSSALRAGVSPIELPSGSSSAPPNPSTLHRESIASNSTMAGSVNTPALLLRTLPDGLNSVTEAGHGMLSTLRQEDNLHRVASTLTSFQKTSPRPQHQPSHNNNNTNTNINTSSSNRGSLGSFRHSLSGVAGLPPKRSSNSKSLCSVCKTEVPQFYCADCVDVPFSLCEDCFHCLEDSAHDPSHRFEVIDGGSVFAASGAGTPIKSNDADDDFTDYSTSEVDEDEDFVGAADPEVPTALFDPCCSCSTQNYHGAIYRCRECAGYILCEKCFIRGKYRHPNTHTIRAVIQAPQILARRRKSGDVKRVVTATKKDSSKTHDDSGNRVINNYVVIKEIGRGSYARVRLLQHLENKELFAVKVLRRELLGNPNATNPTSNSNSPHGGSVGPGGASHHLPLSIGSQSSSVNTVISPRHFASSQFSSQIMSASSSIPNLPLRGQRHSSLCSDDGQHLVPPQTVMDSLREIAVLKLIDHPNVVKLVEVIDDEEGGKVYLIMEYLEGGCIHNLGEPPLSSEDLFNFTSDILASLLHMHSLMLYHQDVKPANCLLTKSGVAKIADFGTCDSRHKVNGVKGTPAFLSPELVMGVDTTGALVDAWAFGVTLYQSASGELPFPITSMYAFNQAITSPKPVEIPSLVEDSDLRDLIALLLEKDVNKRYNLIQAAEHPYYRRGADMKQGRARQQANMVFTPRYAHHGNVIVGNSIFSESTPLNPFHPASSFTSTDQNRDVLANSRSDLLERAGGLIQRGSNVGKSFHGQQLVDRQLQRRIQREHRKNSDSVRSADTGIQDGENSSRRKSSVTVVTPGEEKQQLLNSTSAYQPQNHPNATTLINTYLEHVDALEHKTLNLSNAIIYKDSFLQVLPHTALTLQSLLFFKNISLTSKVLKSIPWSTFKYLTRLRLSNCELTAIPLDILFGVGFEAGLASGSSSQQSPTSTRQENGGTAVGGSISSSTYVSDGPLSPQSHLQSPITPSPNYELPTFGGCPFIEKLDLSYNYIEDVPEIIGEYAALVSLDLEGNSITTFPGGRAFKSLKKVNLSGNVLRNLPANGLLDATGHGLHIALDDHPNLKEEWARSLVANSLLRTITVLWTGIYPKQPAPAVVPQLLIGTLEQSLYFGSVKAEFDIRHFVVPSPMLEEFERMNQLSDRVVAAESLSLSNMSTGVPRSTPPDSRSPRTNENVDNSVSVVNSSTNPISTLFLHPLQSSTNTALPPGEGGNTSSSQQSIITIPNHHATSQNTIMNISAAEHSHLFRAGSGEEYGSGGSGGGGAPTVGSGNTTTSAPSSFRASMSSSQQLTTPQHQPVKSSTGPQQKRTPSPGTSTVPTGSTSDASPFTRSRYSHFAVTPTLIRRRSHKRIPGNESSSRGGSLATASQTSIPHVASVSGSKRTSSQHHRPSQDSEKLGELNKLQIAAKSQTAVFDSTKSSLNLENNASSLKSIIVSDPAEQTNAFPEEIVGLSTVSPTNSGGLSQHPSNNTMIAALNNNNLTTTMSMSAALPDGATLVPTATMFIESPRSSPAAHSLAPGTRDSSHTVPSLDQSIDSLQSHNAGPSRTVVKVLERKSSNPQYQHIYHGMHCFTDVSGPTMGARTSSKEEMQVSGSISTTYTIQSSNEPALLRYLIENIVNRKESVLLLLDPTKLTRAEAALITHCARLLLVDHFGLSTEVALEALRSCGASATTPSPPSHLVTSSPESLSSHGTDSVIQQTTK